MPSLKTFRKKYTTEENFGAVLGKYCEKRLIEMGKSSIQFEESDIFVRWGSWGLGKVPGNIKKHPLSAIPLFNNGSPVKTILLMNPEKMFSLVGLGSKYVEY